MSRIGQSLALAGVLVFAHATPRTARPVPVRAIDRQALSAGTDDWEPSLALGAPGQVIVSATRRTDGPDSSIRTVVWTSEDGGRRFGPSAIAVDGHRMQGDARVAADRKGTVHLSWIGVEVDSTGRPDMARSGLVVATSTDRGRTFRDRLAAPLESAFDKPELAVTPDGRDLYVAVEGMPGLNLVASHDGGASWTTIRSRPATFGRVGPAPSRWRRMAPSGSRPSP